MYKSYYNYIIVVTIHNPVIYWSINCRPCRIRLKNCIRK